MIILRPFKKCDAKLIASWHKDEKAFYQWSADRINKFPLTEEILLEHYEGFASNPDAFVMVAQDDKEVIGQILMRYKSEDRTSIHFGFIIVDSEKRGRGYGKKMLQTGLRYAAEILGVTKVTLGVFANNPSAKKCYESVGFKDTGKIWMVSIMGEEWECIDMEWNKETSS